MLKLIKTAKFWRLKESDRLKIRKKAQEGGVSLLTGVLRYAFLIGSAFILIYPIIYMLSMAFRPASDMSNPTVVWIPTRIILENIKGIWHYMKYPELLKNTLFLCVVSAVLQVMICCWVGYGFARFNFKGKNVFFVMLMLTIIVPPQATFVSNYLLITNFDPLKLLKLGSIIIGQPITMKIYDTPWAFWLPAVLGMGIRSGIFIIIYRQFFRNLPSELEQAASVDGCGPIRTFFKVMLPNCIPAVMIVFLFSVVWYWNDTFYATSYTDTLRTVSVKLAELKADIFRFLPDLDGNDPYVSLVWLQAGAMMSVAPMMILYVLCQRQFVESVERSGLVG